MRLTPAPDAVMPSSPRPPPRLLRLTPENRKTCEESLSTGSEPQASHFLPRWCFRPSRVAQNHRARPAEAARTGCWAPRTTYPPHRPDPDDPASAHSPTCERVGAGQVVTREVDEGMVLRVDELGLRGHVAGVLHGAGRVDDVLPGALDVTARLYEVGAQAQSAFWCYNACHVSQCLSGFSGPHAAWRGSGGVSGVFAAAQAPRYGPGTFGIPSGEVSRLLLVT